MLKRVVLGRFGDRTLALLARWDIRPAPVPSPPRSVQGRTPRRIASRLARGSLGFGPGNRTSRRAFTKPLLISSLQQRDPRWPPRANLVAAQNPSRCAQQVDHDGLADFDGDFFFSFDDAAARVCRQLHLVLSCLRESGAAAQLRAPQRQSCGVCSSLRPLPARSPT